MNMTREHYPNPGAYVRLWKRLKAAPAEQQLEPHAAWYWGDTVEEVLRRMHNAVHARINSRGGIDRPRGRYDNKDYYYQEWRDKHAIEGRCRIYQFETRVCRARFSHLLSSYDEI